MNSKYFKISAISVIILALMIAVSGCASFDNYVHRNYKYGEIIEINKNEVIFCMGSQERVRIGQILDVFKSIKASPGFTRRYKNIKMGDIQITGFVDKLKAKATILHGTIDKDCLVGI